MQTEGEVGKNDILSRQAAREREEQEKEEEETDKFLLGLGKRRYTKHQAGISGKSVQETSSNTAAVAVSRIQSPPTTSTSSPDVPD